MSIPLTLKTREDIETEIGKAVPQYKCLSKEGFWGEEFLDKAFVTLTGRAEFSVPEIDVTPHEGERRHYLFSENYFDLKIRSRLAG
jgi:hypothetical protein